MNASIFYFDDDDVLLDIFKEMFRNEYDVRTASTLAEARQRLSECPDIIISDWCMPEISGIDFLRESAKTCPESFRIMLTGFAHAGDLIGEISSGVVQLFIPKPWNETGMRETLERALFLRSRQRKKGA